MGRKIALTATTALVGILAGELFYYPQLATVSYKLYSNHGWDGSGLRYYQLFYIVPVGCVFAVATLVSVMWALRVNAGRAAIAVAAAYFGDIVLFLASLAYYRSIMPN
jgi:hypothetical protein